MADVFISYSHANEHSRHLAAALAKRLRSAKVPVWYDEVIVSGDQWATQMEKRLEEASTFVILLTEDSLQSPTTNFELGVAASRARSTDGVRLIPVVLEGTSLEQLPKFLRGRQVIFAGKKRDDSTAKEIVEVVTALSS